MASREETERLLDAVEALNQEIDAYESELLRQRHGADVELVATTMLIKGIEEKLYSAKAQLCRLDPNSPKSEQDKWAKQGREAADLKVRAARALAMDEARKANEDEQRDEAARKAAAALQ